MVDDTTLPEPERANVRMLVQAAARSAAGLSADVRPDAGTHHITITDAGQARTITARDGALSDEVAQLIEWIQRHGTRSGGG